MNWGFIGYGRIAKKFEESLKHSDHRIVAIASRSLEQHPDPEISIYNDYDSLLLDASVDIVYINLIHNLHGKFAAKALKAGKHVLCEKPLTTSLQETTELINSAQKANRFLMEAIWTRFLPGYRKAMEMIHQGVIGEVHLVQANFGFKMNPDDPKERLIRPELAAGAVWDVGIYPLSLVQHIYEVDPLEVQVQSHNSEFNVENSCFVQMSFPNDKFAQWTCSVESSMHNHAIIHGNQGQVIMEKFWKCERFKVIKGDNIETFDFPMVSNGLYHEAIAVATYIHQGVIQSEEISFDHSKQLAKLMDQIILKAR